MVKGVLLADSSQDADRLGDGRLVDHDLSESALEGTVLLDVLSVLVKRRRLQGSEKVQLDLFEDGRIFSRMGERGWGGGEGLTPMHLSFPRASTGLSKFAASIPSPPLPAIIRCISALENRERSQ